MKSKVVGFFVVLMIIGIPLGFFFHSADNSMLSGASNQSISGSDDEHTSAPGLEKVDQPAAIPNNLNLARENTAERQDVIDGIKSKEDLAFEEWTQMMSLAKEMRLRSGRGSTVFAADEFVLVSEWRENTGQFDISELLEGDYGAYDLKTLLKMGQEGDLKAVAISIDAIRGNPDSPLRPSLNYLRKEAVIAGSTHELYELGAQHSINAREAKARGDEKAYRQEIVEALAYSHMQIARGVGDAIMTISATIQNHEIQDDHELLDKAEQRGRKLYIRFSELRREKGWGEFDNSVPDPVKRMHANNICKNEKACVDKILNN